MGILPFKKQAISEPTLTQRIEEQKNVEIGLKFMKKDGVEVIPPTVKRIFLQKKGLREEEIQKVFRLHEQIKQIRFRDVANETTQKIDEKKITTLANKSNL